MAPRLRNSPFKSRAKDPTSPLLEERDAADAGARPYLFDRDATLDSLHTSVREVKLHELREDCARWQRDYETMREQVIEEKARQVALFQRLEVLRRSHATQLRDAEAALRASQADVERLQTRLAQARVSAAHEARRTASLVQSSRSERQRLVCALAETRHKFREWKEGEAATLRATREQAVHALRTEYELKLARHQEEKQKLRDKVKDLEVSLRLLQRDRQLSPGELSERKGTLLHHNSSGAGFGDVGAADFIEAQGRIHELEALLQLSRERQERQDALLCVSEAALARLSQERELDALENLSLPSPAVALVLSNLTGDLQVEDSEKPDTADSPTPVQTAEPSIKAPEVVPMRELRSTEREGSAATINIPPSTPTWNPPRRQSISGGGSTDLEKEILRRKSIALSAEVNRYQKIVVQSMEEVRALKESRRRSRTGSISSSAMVLSPREAYLLEELAVAQREIDAMKAKLKRKRRKDKAKTKVGEANPVQTETGDADPHTTSSSESDNSNDSSNSSDSDDDSVKGGPTVKRTAPLVSSKSQPRMSLIQENGHEEEREEKEPLEAEAAVKVIQTYSKGFLARREFIRKKLAIGKIKARYRGYLVRKNYEAVGGGLPPAEHKLLSSGLAPQETPDVLIVTEAMQYKMQIVEPHHEASYICEGSNSPDLVDVVLRVSKDPPVVQLQVASTDEPIAVPCVTYFHLFEAIALLPYEDEETILETSSEKEIARIFASRLVVQRKGPDDDYHFFIARPVSMHGGDARREDPTLNLEARTPLTELPVQPMETRAISASSDVADASLDGIVPPGQEIDLDLLIREARTDPLNEETTQPRSSKGSEPVTEDPATRIRRLVKRLSSSSFDSIDQ
ncbi:unnamed protein product [Phytophthora fragariaefolia]|uniref:Unnamed protein product n=1 Tax=Phytophthora fragariaefolia TaxID=1490495 RepID=A0A9W7CIJ2_9STRA|nr:unnamed protein product [Phytophthora fragariaefolia]